MPWSQGPNSGSNRGKKNNNGDQSENGGRNDHDDNPWEHDSSSFGRRRRHGGQPNIEDLIRDLQERLPFGRRGGGGNDSGDGPSLPRFFNFSGIIAILTLLVVIWLATGIYRVGPGQRGVELVFGSQTEVTSPGLHYNFPSPIGDVLLPEVERSRRINIGYEALSETSDAIRDVPKQSFILTGDENIVDMDFTVFWKIRDPVAYLFNIRNPEATIQLAAESVMREVVGQTTFDQTVTTGRQDIEFRSESLLQTVLDGYESGVEIESVVLQKSDPPAEVIDAFNDVQRARQDQDRKRNEAEAYANSIVPSARGQAEQMIRIAEAYKERLINEAIGEASRFQSVLESYKANPEVTRKRMYIETVSDVLQGADKIILDSDGNGVVPILPLPEIRNRLQNNQTPESSKTP